MRNFEREIRWYEMAPFVDILGSLCAIGRPMFGAVAIGCRYLEQRCERGIAIEQAAAEYEAMLDADATEA